MYWFQLIQSEVGISRAISSMILRLDVIDAGCQFLLTSSWHLPVSFPKHPSVGSVHLTFMLKRYMFHANTVLMLPSAWTNHVFSSLCSTSKLKYVFPIVVRCLNYVDSHFFLATCHGWELPPRHISVSQTFYSPACLASWSSSKSGCSTYPLVIKHCHGTSPCSMR